MLIIFGLKRLIAINRRLIGLVFQLIVYKKTSDFTSLKLADCDFIVIKTSDFALDDRYDTRVANILPGESLLGHTNHYNHVVGNHFHCSG